MQPEATRNMRLQKLAIVLIIGLSLIPAYYINRQMLRYLQPRKSLLRLLLYLVLSLALVFIYTFFLVVLIFAIFPVPNG